jgi:hypothetical protein
MFGLLISFLSCSGKSFNSYNYSAATQLTFGAKDHYLGIFNAFSGDDEWIVYCCGPNHLNEVIEKVSTKTGETVTLYKIDNQTRYGPGCGTPRYCPTEDKIVFIHGPRKFGPDQKYEFWRRSAAAIEEPNHNKPVFLDARDVTYPFTPGALRGGTHCHEWSHDGEWVAFTYNDMIMAKLEAKTGENYDLRTIGVSKNLRSVDVDKDPEGENFDGKWFSVLLVEVMANPASGSDEICKAYENCWVGEKGYKNQQGEWQRAIAFKGDVVTENGDKIPEVYIVDIPEKIDKPADGKPLEGTKTKMPFPPEGAEWRRLTYTIDRKYPGLSIEPRFWLRTGPKGDKIFFLARDDGGINQIYYVPSIGGDIQQVTSNKYDVMSTPSINSNGKELCYICDGSVFVSNIETGKTIRLTEKSKESISNPIWSNYGDKIVFGKPVSKETKPYKQLFIIER